MSKTKAEEKLNRLVKESVADELNNENLAEYDDTTDLIRMEKESEKNNYRKIYSILRQVLLFAPGAIFLWVTSWGITEGLLTQSRVPRWAYFVFVLSFFMVLSGLGDVRKRRDYFIPLASVLFGVGFGIAAGLFTDYLRMFVNFISSIGLISLSPLIWIVPLAVKLRLEATEKKDVSE